MLNIYKLDQVEALAQFLQVKEEDIQIWDDDSYTLSYNDRHEYYVADKESIDAMKLEGFTHCVGLVEDWKIFKV